MDSSWINVNGENVQTLQILLMTTLVTLAAVHGGHDDVLYPVHHLLFLPALSHGTAAKSPQHGAGGYGTVSDALYHVPGDQPDSDHGL